MFCKYCGQPIVDGKCSHCGKEAVYISHSTELEKMLAHNPVPARVATKEVPEKTYDQGFDAGYQKGLTEGYRNGVNEAKPDPQPARYIPWKMIAILCGAALIIGAAASGFLFRNIGFRDGLIQGETAGKRAAEEAQMFLDEKYSQGIEAGKQEGYKLGFEAGNKEGYSQGKADAINEAARVAELEREAASTLTDNEDVLFSRSQNGSTKSQEVSAVQAMLYELNMYAADATRDAAVDGKYGRQTENAVRKFQTEKGLPASGNLDRATYNALLAEYSSGKETDRSIINDMSFSEIVKTLYNAVFGQKSAN